MKIILNSIFLLSAVLFYNAVQAKEKTMTCVFPNQSDQMIMENCAKKNQSGSLQILKSVLAIIKFDSEGLAGGSIANEGCYWLSKKGVLRKTHCFDNGADYFEDGLARYIDASGKFGYMNRKLQIKIPARYTFAFPFQDGRAKVCNHCVKEKAAESEHSIMANGEWMIINKKGDVLKTCSSGSKGFETCLK